MIKISIKMSIILRKI